MLSTIVAVASFVGVAALVGGVAMMFRGASDNKLEDRLDVLTGCSTAVLAKDALERSVLSKPLDNMPGFLERLVDKLGNLGSLFNQADCPLTPAQFFVATAGLGGAAAMVTLFSGVHPGFAPVAAVVAAALPLVWLIMRRRGRLAKFAAQLPQALELIARALRAGHSLAAGFDLVAEEMPEPIATEFGRVFEEQNLGIPLDDALRSLTNRVPNLDLKFFATAVILQRQTGGDLAEILDKIGHLVRERFAIWGQVQALTGEGRLSGVVLLALPPVLFIAIYRMNPEYVMVLFSDELGKKMLVGGIISQIIGALVIRKIVNIKV